jgi:hypothetical protein
MAVSNRNTIIVFALVCTVATAHATPYWIAWEGDDWPENQGWIHNSYNYYGGPLAIRALGGGTMTIDGSASPGIVDFYRMSREGAMDPGPGEEFRLQYRMRVDASTGYPWDVDVSVFSNDARLAGLCSTVDRVRPTFAATWEVSFEPGQFHTYEIRSTDMWEYRFFLDESLVQQGTFVQSTGSAYVGWGDCCVPAASAATWDYLRFGVVRVPEVSGAAAVISFVFTAVARCHRRSS